MISGAEMRKSLQRGGNPLDFPMHGFNYTNQLPEYPSLSECVERLSALSSEVLEDVAIQTTSTPLKKLAWEIQELMQILSLHQNFLTTSPSIEDQKKIQYMAFYDGLTRLPNRQFFEMYIRQLIKSSNSSSLFYLVFLDLDGFKEINDTHGHETGDTLLKHVAKRLRQNLRREDFVARFGGDEFIIILDSDENQDLDFILNRMISIISRPYTFDTLHLKINASLGVAKYPGSDESVEDLMKKADKAMYMSKSKGSNLYTLSF